MKRRGMLALTAGTLTAGFAGYVGAAQEGNETTSQETEYSPLDSDEIDDSWPIENRENADVIIDSDTDDDVESTGNVVVTADVELDGNLAANGSVVLEEDAEVDGTVTVGDHVLLEADAAVDDDVTAGGMSRSKRRLKSTESSKQVVTYSSNQTQKLMVISVRVFRSENETISNQFRTRTGTFASKKMRKLTATLPRILSNSIRVPKLTVRSLGRQPNYPNKVNRTKAVMIPTTTMPMTMMTTTKSAHSHR